MYANLRYEDRFLELCIQTRTFVPPNCLEHVIAICSVCEAQILIVFQRLISQFNERLFFGQNPGRTKGRLHVRIVPFS